jgi:hypothetical protein
LIREPTDEGIERIKKSRARSSDAPSGWMLFKRGDADHYGKGATTPELAQENGVGVGTIWRSLQPDEGAGASAR